MGGTRGKVGGGKGRVGSGSSKREGIGREMQNAIFLSFISVKLLLKTRTQNAKRVT